MYFLLYISYWYGFVLLILLVKFFINMSLISFMVREFRSIFIFFLFLEFDGVFVVCFCWFFGFFGEVWFDSLVFVDIFFCCGIMGTFSCWYMMSFIGGVLDLMFLLVYMYRFLLAELFGSETVDIFFRFWCFG